jgi:hypothetical protein
MHNDAIVTDDHQKFGGSSSYGDFGTMMKLLFEPSINAAAKSVLLGSPEDIARADEYAAKVQGIVGTEPKEDDYW